MKWLETTGDVKFIPNNTNIKVLKQLRKFYKTEASKVILDKHLDILLTKLINQNEITL